MRGCSDMVRTNISEIVFLFGVDAPQSATRRKGAFVKLASRKQIHIPDEIKNVSFRKMILDLNLPIKITSGLKIKMVHMVHSNLFYNAELEFCD